MKTIKLTFILFTAITLSLVSCDKEDDSDTTAPTITISSPTDGVEDLMSGDVVDIMISITDNDDVHDSYASLTRTQDGETVEVWALGGHQHGDEVMIEGSYTIEVPGMHNEFLLTVTAEDHSGNEAVETASFHVHM